MIKFLYKLLRWETHSLASGHITGIAHSEYPSFPNTINDFFNERSKQKAEQERETI